MAMNSFPAVLRFSLFILWLLAFPMNGFLLERTGLEHPLLFFAIPQAVALFTIRYLMDSRFFPAVMNTAIIVVIAGTALFPFAGKQGLPLLAVMGVAGASLLIKTLGNLNRLPNPLLAGAICLAGGNLALLVFMKLPLSTPAFHLLLALLLLVPLFSEAPRPEGQTEMGSLAWYLPFLFVYNLVSGLMYGALMTEYVRHAYIGGIELLFYAGMAFAGAYLVRRGKDLLLVLGILGGMLSFSLFLVKGVPFTNLSMFAFQGAAGFVDIFILALLFSRADCLRVAGPVFGTVCAGIAGGYAVSSAAAGVASIVVGAANLILTAAVFIFVFLVKRWQANPESISPPDEEALSSPPAVSLSRTLKKRLSVREQAVLECVLRQKTFRETAEALALSESSVKTYMKRIYEKTGVTGKDELFTVLANEKGSIGEKEG